MGGGGVVAAHSTIYLVSTIGFDAGGGEGAAGLCPLNSKNLHCVQSADIHTQAMEKMSSLIEQTSLYILSLLK